MFLLYLPINLQWVIITVLRMINKIVKVHSLQLIGAFT
jgi:hypothetical protein